MRIVAFGYFIASLAAYYSYWLLLFLFLVLVLAYCLRILRLSWLLLLVLGALAGFLLAHQRIVDYHQTLLPHEYERTWQVVNANIDSIVHQRDDGTLVFDATTSINNSLGLAKRRLRLKWYGNQNPPALGQGQIVRLNVKLKRPHGYTNGVGFNYEAYLQANQIHAVGYIKSCLKGCDALSNTTWRQRLYDELIHGHDFNSALSQSQLQSQSERITNALLAALVLGETRAIPSSIRTLFTDSGIAHVLAISGLHIGFVAWLLFWLTRMVLFTWLSAGVARVAHYGRVMPIVVSWLGVLFYAYVAGFSLPTQRALIMISVFYLAVLLQRRQPLLTGLWAGLLLILLWSPEVLLSIGFWLSFGAVAWIALLLHVLPNHWRAWRKTLSIQLILPIGLSPVIQYGFASVAGLAAVVNIVVVPLVGFVILPLSFLYVFVLAVFDARLSHIHTLLSTLFEGLIGVLNGLSSFQWAQPLHPSYDAWALLLLLFGMLLVVAAWFVYKPLSFLGLLFCVLALLSRPSPLEHGVFSAEVLDVGQGMSVLIQTKHHTLLYDTGAAYPSGFSLAEAVIDPLLNQRGITAIDMLVASHDDNDHVGGVSYLLKTRPIQALRMGQPERFRYTEVSESDVLSTVKPSQCLAGQSWEWDGVKFEVLWPSPAALDWSNNEFNDNVYSCVISVRGADHSLLLTGDIEYLAEQRLIRRMRAQNQSLKHDALLVPHHGSKTSSSQAFLQAVRPNVALISAGYVNRYYHPHSSVLKRYHRADIKWMNTASCGRLFYSSNGWRCHRAEYTMPWQICPMH